MMFSFLFAFLLQTCYILCDNHHNSIFHLIQEPEVGSPPRPIYYQMAKNSPKSHYKSRPHCHKMLQMTLPMAYIGGEKLLETFGDIYT